MGGRGPQPEACGPRHGLAVDAQSVRVRDPGLTTSSVQSSVSTLVTDHDALIARADVQAIVARVHAARKSGHCLGMRASTSQAETHRPLLPTLEKACTKKL